MKKKMTKRQKYRYIGFAKQFGILNLGEDDMNPYIQYSVKNEKIDHHSLSKRLTISIDRLVDEALIFLIALYHEQDYNDIWRTEVVITCGDKRYCFEYDYSLYQVGDEVDELDFHTDYRKMRKYHPKWYQTWMQDLKTYCEIVGCVYTDTHIDYYNSTSELDIYRGKSKRNCFCDNRNSFKYIYFGNSGRTTMKFSDMTKDEMYEYVISMDGLTEKEVEVFRILDIMGDLREIQENPICQPFNRIFVAVTLKEDELAKILTTERNWYRTVAFGRWANKYRDNVDFFKETKSLDLPKNVVD